MAIRIHKISVSDCCNFILLALAVQACSLQLRSFPLQNVSDPTKLYSPPLENILALYEFTDAAGTSLKDSSGNSNDANFTAPYPNWLSYGLNFTPGNEFTGSINPQTVLLPDAINTWQTVFLHSCIYSGPQNNLLS